ncbi:hypothetical protein ACJX0J_014413, partial [Zea mays]
IFMLTLVLLFPSFFKKGWTQLEKEKDKKTKLNIWWTQVVKTSEVLSSGYLDDILLKGGSGTNFVCVETTSCFLVVEKVESFKDTFTQIYGFGRAKMMELELLLELSGAIMFFIFVLSIPVIIYTLLTCQKTAGTRLLALLILMHVLRFVPVLVPAVASIAEYLSTTSCLDNKHLQHGLTFFSDENNYCMNLIKKQNIFYFGTEGAGVHCVC